MRTSLIWRPVLLHFLLLLGLVGTADPAAAQTGTVSGLVVDSSGTPLPGVNVLLEGTRLGAATDVDGRFRIREVDPGAYTIVASSIGFSDSRRSIDVVADSDLVVRLTLKEKSFMAHEILVTASRRTQLSAAVAASFDVIEPKDLEIRSVTHLDQALRYVSGVQVMENQVNIRGSSGYSYNVGSRVLLLLDGLPLLTPDSDGVPFDALPFAQVDRIEVIKGPGSALWGSGALGGVIHVITKDYPQKPTSMVRVSYGFHDPVSREDWLEKWPEGRDPRPFWNLTLSHAQKIGSKFGFWFSGDYRDDRGYANMKTERFGQLYAKVGWKPTQTTRFDMLVAGLSRRKENFLFWNGLNDALNPGLPTIGGEPDKRGVTDVHTDQLTIEPSYRQVISDQVLLETRLRAYGTRIEGVNDDETRSGNVTHGFRFGGDTQINWNPTSSRNIVLGVSGDMNTTSSPFFVTDAGNRIGNQPELAVFGQYEDQLVNRIHVVAGLRYTSYAVTTVTTVDKLSPKIALSVNAARGLSFRAAFGQGFRVPSLAERFIDDQAYVPLYPNFELRPEESTSYEVGFRLDSSIRGGWSFRLDGAGFWNEFDGLIEPKLVRISEPGDSLVLGFQFVNLRHALIVGFETELNVGLPRGVGTAYAGYTFMSSKDLEEGDPLPFRPQHLLNAGFHTRVYGPIETGADFKLVSAPQSLDSDFALFVPDSDVWIPTRTVDYWIAASFRSARLAFHVRNLFDYYYVERPAFLGAPRHYFAELRFDL